VYAKGNTPLTAPQTTAKQNKQRPTHTRTRQTNAPKKGNASFLFLRPSKRARHFLAWRAPSPHIAELDNQKQTSTHKIPPCVGGGIPQVRTPRACRFFFFLGGWRKHPTHPRTTGPLKNKIITINSNNNKNVTAISRFKFFVFCLFVFCFI
jgi:hypothetical protein